MDILDLPGIRKVNRGKVREIFEVDKDHLLIVATDRISAFDVVLPNTIPHKGKVLNQLSSFWFEQVKHIVPNHVISARVDDFPTQLQPFREQLRGRSMLVRRCQPLPVECVARGYLAGSGWKEYRESGTICGIKLPPGLREADELPEPIFTPATKAVTGHDENIPFERVIEILGPDTAHAIRDFTLKIYGWARGYARERGIIICDTKFEFGYQDSHLLLIDEVLTPDSSRFWPASEYQPGGPQPSFDKQFIRDYLETLDWDKTAPGPELPEEIVTASSHRYTEAYRRLTGKELEI
ncbi:MAG: phosphoribosylaminoimidazolesuccinocarboxamide synthase [Acidobacteria bacterium]|nr:MAG: phosphoribosylaminoimidazolesuccinocarboxamide synthase [Acidobacteriota bacterium]